MKRHALIIMLSLSLAALPLLGRAQNDPAGSGADADAEGSASCARIQLGAVVTDSDTQSQKGPAEEGGYYEDGYYYDEYYDAGTGFAAPPQQGAEVAESAELVEEELWCDEPSAPGPLKCYEGDNVIECHFDGADVYCPY